jgi:hypothetical protein
VSGKVCLRAFSAALIMALCFCALPKISVAQDKYAGAFLQIPVGGHALSMGAAYTAIANDESAFHWNPAGVSLLDHKYFGFMYSSEFGLPGSALANFFQFGMTYPMENASVALNWVRLGVGDMSHTPDLTGINITSEREKQVFNSFNGTQDIFSDVQDAVVLSVARNNKFVVDWGWLYYSHPIEIPIGVNFKYIHQKVGTFGTAQGIGIDAGMMLRFSLADYLLVPILGKVSVGLNVNDIGGTKLSWSTQHQQTVPMRIIGGTAYTQELSFINAVATLACDFGIHESEKPHFGLDVTYAENISVRLGLDQGDFAAGAGFIWQKKLKLDYSLSLHDLGPEHRLSFGVDIDNILNPAQDSTEVGK